jgi:hypothetical protein
MTIPIWLLVVLAILAAAGLFAVYCGWQLLHGWKKGWF